MSWGLDIVKQTRVHGLPKSRGLPATPVDISFMIPLVLSNKEAVVIMAERIVAGLQSGWADLSSSTAWGDDMEVADARL